MSIEFTEDQLERLVGMLADNRVAISEGLADLERKITKKIDDLKVGIGLTQKTLDAVEQDLGEVQKKQREHTQALEGLTELASTNFDLLESLNKHIHGESGSISHGAASRGTRTQ